MAEEEPSRGALSSTFPDPPHFWKDFTPENVEKIEALKASLPEQYNEDGSLVRIPQLPSELVTLQPPAEPADGRWRVFGDNYSLDDKLPSLEEQGIQRLVSTQEKDQTEKRFDRAFELKKLAKSLLVNFLELMGIMSINPTEAEAKIADLRTLFINVHHTLNDYRPHQAREQAIALMQSHLDQIRAETAAIRAPVDKARRVLEGLSSIKVTDYSDLLDARNSIDGKGKDTSLREKTVEARGLEVWAAAGEVADTAFEAD